VDKPPFSMMMNRTKYHRAQQHFLECLDDINQENSDEAFFHFFKMFTVVLGGMNKETRAAAKETVDKLFIDLGDEHFEDIDDMIDYIEARNKEKNL
jgi:hypothetical protein